MMDIKRRHLYMIMRKEKGIRHTEIAKVIGVSQSAISQYETGKIQLKHETRSAYEEYINNN
jgi:predicted transcriptional regulator